MQLSQLSGVFGLIPGKVTLIMQKGGMGGTAHRGVWGGGALISMNERKH